MVLLPVLLVSLLVIAAAAPAAAQPNQSKPLGPPDRLEATPVSPYLIDTWTIEDGLPQGTVTAIVQTRDGYLWLATVGGLARFDGVTFQVFSAADTPGLGSDRVLSLYEDRAGTLWIGTERDGVFMRRGNVLSRPAWDAALPGRQIWAFYESDDGVLWVGTGNGLARVEHGGVVSTYRLDDGRVARTITESSDGILWFGTHGGGLARVVDNRLRRFPFHEVEPRASVQALYFDAAGVLWIGTVGGLYRLHDERVERIPFPGNGGRRWVTALSPDGQGGIWLGTEDGLCHEREGRVTCPEGTRLPNTRVRALTRDREGNLWIGTQGHGLSRLKRRAAITYAPDRGASAPLSVLPIVGDGAGGLWLGGTCGGLFHFREGVFEHQPLGLERFKLTRGVWSSDACIWALHRDPDNTLWIGTSIGLGRLKDGRITFYSSRHGLISSVVTAIVRDRDGVLWVGTHDGINRMEADGTFVGQRLPGAPLSVFCVIERRAGGLWIGTSAGLMHYAGRVVTRVTTEHSLSHNHVRAVLEDPDGTLWIGTYGGGLNRLRHGRVTQYTRATGLFDNVVSRILDDGRGNLWMSGNRGVFRVARRELEAVAHGRQRKVTSVGYDKRDGMASSETNSTAGQPAGWQTPDGRLWFPTIAGLVAFDPSVPTNQQPPPAVITRVVIDQQERDLSGELIVPAGTHNVEIHYAGLSFVAPHKVRFQYQLEGYDDEWTDADTRREAYYTGLPPGRYRFRVRARNEDGVWSATDAVLPVRQEPHIYQTWSFIVVCALLVAAMVGLAVYMLHRIKLERALALERMRMRIATDLHDDIGGTLSRMAIVSEVAKQQAVLPPDVERRIDDLGETARGLVDAMSDVIWSIDPRRDHLASLLLRVREHATDVLDGKALSFESPVDAEVVRLSPDQRRQLYLLLKEALTNVAKHACAEHVVVAVALNGHLLDVEVHDDGRGFDPDAPALMYEPRLPGDRRRTPRLVPRLGNGLTNMRSRAAALGGRLDIRSGSAGTTVQVQVPLVSSTRSRRLQALMPWLRSREVTESSPDQAA